MMSLKVKIWTLLLLAACHQKASSQSDILQMYIIASAKTGIYLNIDDFRNNTPLQLSRIKSEDGFANAKYLFSLKKGDEIVFHDRYGMQKRVSASEIWGYCTGEDIYVNAGIGYSKLEIIGSISYFIADVLVEEPTPTAMMSRGSSSFAAQPRYTYERQAVLLDLSTGIMLESSPRNLEKIITADSSLHSLYTGLRGKEQQKQVIQVITDYNARNPFRFAE